MKAEILEFLSSHEIIHELEEKTAITLDDLLAGKIYTVIPADADLVVSPKHWYVGYSTEITQREHDRLRDAFRGNGMIVQDAAMLVAAVTRQNLSERQKKKLHEGTEIADHNFMRRKKTLQRERQTVIAKKERNADFNRIVERLAAKKHVSGAPMRPAELWPELYAEIENAGEGIEERLTEKQEPQYRYELNGKTGTITLRGFTNKLSRIRKKS